MANSSPTYLQFSFFCIIKIESMASRRQFLVNSAFLGAGLGLGFFTGRKKNDESGEVLHNPSRFKGGLVISTWNHGLPANEAAWKIISEGGRSVDAAEAGVRVPEADPESQSVGYGGLPDRDGNVTLDACIMDEYGNAGSVSFLQGIKHPVSVARKVMDLTPHVMLSGEGARQFALAQGFAEENLLTPESRKAWQNWLSTSEYKPIINIENHDTIGLLAMDLNGNISGACTTSGLAYKMHGRVGDSPVIGAGLFVDNEVGGATATGLGEAVLKTCGSFLVVELMRQGASPREACEEAVQRIAAKQNYKDMQIGYLAVNKAGETGAFAVHPGFNYALMKDGTNRLIDCESLVKG
jgi:N4-(beta-N-acetylglucosaminyl)-L-asparaginase